MITTSYKSKGMNELLTALVKSVGAKKIIELGTQQGHSAILLAKGGGQVLTYDLFEKKYSHPPFKETHANLLNALNNVKKHNVKVYVKDAFKVWPVKCDVLHIDICNHYANVLPLLLNWESSVKKMIILEGGVYNKWQKKHGFKPFNEVLTEGFMHEWNHVVIKGKDGYAMTILTRR